MLGQILEQLLEPMMIFFLQTKAGWFIAAVFGGGAVIFMISWVLFFAALAVGSMYTILKTGVDAFTSWKTSWTGAHKKVWKGTDLGYTMADGGEPISKDKEGKES